MVPGLEEEERGRAVHVGGPHISSHSQLVLLDTHANVPFWGPGPTSESGPLQPVGLLILAQWLVAQLFGQAVLTALLSHRVCPQCHIRA